MSLPFPFLRPHTRSIRRLPTRLTHSVCAPTRRYILRDGDGTCLEAHVDGVGKVMTYKAGEFFGELALLTGGKRAATGVASGAAGSRAQLLKLSSEDFLRLTDDDAAGTVLKTQTQSYKGANPKVDMDAILAALPGLGAS